MITNNGSTAGKLGLSTDQKPTTDVETNDLFLELDTGDLYYFNGTTWKKVGAN